MAEKIAGILAILAFILVLMIGMFFNQPMDEIAMKSMVALVLFYILGFIFGEAGSLVVLEKMEKFDLEKWARDEGKGLGVRLRDGQIVAADDAAPVPPPATEAPKTPA